MHSKDENLRNSDLQDANLRDGGLRKAAVLVAGLDRKTADEMLDQLTPEQARAVRQMMVDLGEIDPAEQRRVVDEFFRIGPLVPEKEPPGVELDVRPSRGYSPHGNLTRGDLAARPSPPEGLLCGVDPAEPPYANAKPFQSLSETEAERLARVLADERPQTIALVLAHLPPERAGSVLTRLPDADQVEVIHRLIDMEETDPVVLRDVERALQMRLSQQVPMQRRRVAGLQAVHGILEASDGQVGMQILDNLAMHDGALAERLGSKQLEFDDLVQLDDAALVMVFDTAGPELAITALIGASPELIDRVLGRLPPTEANAIRRQLDHPGAIRLSDMEDARQRIAQTARRLAVEGRIELAATTPSHNGSLSYAA
ncbi:MAG: FliG C-terminal domain-containing protein [Thermoguttaceae bacterium]